MMNKNLRFKKLKYNKWSPYENGRVLNNPEYYLNKLRKFAEAKGGKLISTEYINGNTKLELEDKNVNVFYKIASKIKTHKFA